VKITELVRILLAGLESLIQADVHFDIAHITESPSSATVFTASSDGPLAYAAPDVRLFPVAA